MIDTLKQLLDYVIHLNVHLEALVQNYGVWVYLILFLIIFCETGLVVTPFLPGDSLLFAIGALCGVGSLDLGTCIGLLLVAAILGDTVNYWVGYWTGPKVFRMEKSRWLNPKHLDRTHAFMEKYGGKAVVLARFAPIFRTFAPFVAGVGRMSYFRFMVYNVTGALAWVLGFLLVGYYFGNRPAVKENFTIIILAIIVISFLPAVFEFLRHWQARRAAARPAPDQP
jgi:membrane-associated protein